MKFVKLKLFQVCGLKRLKVNKLTLKLKLMTKKLIDNIKIVDNSYSDEEGKKSWCQQISFCIYPKINIAIV